MRALQDPGTSHKNVGIPTQPARSSHIATRSILDPIDRPSLIKTSTRVLQQRAENNKLI
jgi:hypothetical protein